VHTKTYIAVCCIMLRKLGCCTKSPVQRSATGRGFENSWAELNSGSAGYPASGYRNAPGQSSNAAGGDRNAPSRDRHAACENRNPSRAAKSELTRILFAKWNSEPNGARLKLTWNADPRKHYAALNRQSQHPKQSRRLAQRQPLRNSAGHGGWELGHRAEFRIECQPAEPWQRKRPEQ
jgi:hypothetical protein